MYKLIALALIFFQVYTASPSPTCTSTQITYNKVCIEKFCLNSKLAQFQLLQVQQDVLNQGKLSTGLSYQITSSSDANGQFYVVLLTYPDTAANQILSDLKNCINYQIYSTVNTFSINAARQFIIVTSLNDGQIAAWPQTTYSFDGNTASLTFNIREPDMEKNCIKLAGVGTMEYDCNFELSFQVAGITQVSYYFSTRSVINTAVTSAALPPADFVKLIQFDNCVVCPEGECTIRIGIQSALLFCDTISCVKTSQTPFFILFLNRQFYMKHLITDAAFQTWFILNPKISYQSQLLNEKLASSEFTIVSTNAGFNIYGLKVPIVTPQCLISAKGTLGLTANRIRFLQTPSNQTNSSTNNNTENTVFDSVYTGFIYDSSNQTNSATALKSNAQILSSLLFIGLILIV